MSSKLLLPNRYKKLGWLILIPATVLGFILAFNEFGAGWIWARVFSIANEGTDSHYQYLLSDTLTSQYSDWFIFYYRRITGEFLKRKK